MLDTVTKEGLQKLLAELSNPVDEVISRHAAATVMRTLLSEEIAKRPDAPAFPDPGGVPGDPEHAAEKKGKAK